MNRTQEKSERSRRRAASRSVPGHALETASSHDLTPGRFVWLELAAGLSVAIVAIGTIWAEPRPIGDLFTALAVGRDVVDGKLGRPDDWAFTTQGRVCVNQNWGSHLLHYGVYQAAGPTGLLVLKALMIAAAALFVCLAARQRRVSWVVAWTVAAGAIASGRAYIDLRANLTTLMLAPLALWMLWRTRQNAHWMWAVMALNGVWANLHGGFIFGLGMTALWAAVWIGQRAVELARDREAPGAALKTAAVQRWPLGVGALGSVALAAFVNPYGLKNLTFPFTIRDPAWKPLSEWQPLLSEAEFGSTWEFFVAMGLLIGLLLLRAIGIPGVRASYPSKPRLEQASMTVFDLALAGVLVYMTFQARRFVPLSVMLMAPFLAVQIEWLVRVTGTIRKALAAALLTAMTVALLVPLLMHAHTLWLLYSPNNPRYTQETVFERMHGLDAQPVAAAHFLASNRVRGRVFNDWRWEGYLRWMCPRLELFIGGRAHQVYDRSVVLIAGQILANPRVSSADPGRSLVEQGVHLVVVPIDEQHGGLIGYLTARPDSTWGFVFSDGKDVVIADAARPETADLLRRAAAGELTYPDPASALLSRAVALTAGSLGGKPADVLPAFRAAVQAKPVAMAYDAIRQVSRHMPDPASWQKAYFAEEYARLARVEPHRPGGMGVLRVRGQLARYLESLYAADRTAAAQIGHGDAALRASAEEARWKRTREEAQATLEALAQAWP